MPVGYVPVGAPVPWEIVVEVSLTGQYLLDPPTLSSVIPGAGIEWGLNIGGWGHVEGFADQSHGYPASTGASIGAFGFGTVSAGSGAFASCTVTMSWTEQNYIGPGGHFRSVVGQATIAAGSGSYSWTPATLPIGLPGAPDLWVTGATAVDTPGGTHYGPIGATPNSGTTTMKVIRMGPVAFDLTLFSLLGADSIQGISLYGPTYGMEFVYRDFTYTPPTIFSTFPVGWYPSGTATFAEDGSSGSWTTMGYPGDPNVNYVPYTTGAPPSGYVANALIVPSAINGHVRFSPPFPNLSDGWSGPTAVLLMTVAKSTVDVATQASTWPQKTPLTDVPLNAWNTVWASTGQCDGRLDPLIHHIVGLGQPSFDEPTPALVHSDALGRGPTVTFTATGLPPSHASPPPSFPPVADCLPCGLIGPNIYGDNQPYLVYTVAFGGSPTGGTFTAHLWGGALPDTSHITPPLPLNVSCAAFKSALEALPGYSTGEISVTGMPGSIYFITGAGALAGLYIGTLTVDISGLTGGTPTLSLTIDQPTPAPNDDAHYLYANNLDPRGIAGTLVPGEDTAGVVTMGYPTGTLLTVTRAVSKTVEDGTNAADYIDIGGFSGLLREPWNPSGHMTITQVSGGIQFVKTGGGGGTGMARSFAASGDAGKRRCFRHYRYVKIRVTASAACSARISFLSNLNNDTTNPTSILIFIVTLTAGENVFTLDMANGVQVIGGSGNPAETLIQSSTNPGYGNLTDPIGCWSLNTRAAADPFASKYKTALPAINSIAWLNYDVWFVRFDELASGVTYLLEEITCLDLTDGKRTPLRVIGDNCPNSPDLSSSVMETVNGAIPPVIPAYVLRILANGRPCAGFPWAIAEGTSIPVIDDLVARWNDTIDAGAGVWSITNLDPTRTAIIPVGWLEVVPGSVTETGFQLRATAKWHGWQKPVVLIGWKETVGLPIKVNFDIGAQIEGLVMTACAGLTSVTGIITSVTRKPIPGAVVKSTFSNPPASLTPIADPVGVADDDGYFAIAGLRAAWVSVIQPRTLNADGSPKPLVSLLGLAPHTLTVNGDTTNYGALQLSHRTTLHVFVLVHPMIPGRVANLATPDGAFHRVARSFTHLGTGATRSEIFGENGLTPGQDGLSYWRYDPGVPRASNSYGWTAKASIIDPNLVDDYPDIDRDGRGRLYVVFDRQTQAKAPRKADVWETYSDDDGLTWSNPVMTISGGQYPRIRTGKDGSIYRVAYVDDGTGHGIGTLKGQYQAPGDHSPSTAFTLQKIDDTGALVPLVIQDGHYDIDHLQETASRWVISVLEDQATTPAEYVSADDGGGTYVRQGAATPGSATGAGGNNMSFNVAFVHNTSNVTLSGPQTLDSGASGDNLPVLLGGQTIPAQNGFWITNSAGAWTRPLWYASGSTVQPGITAWAAPGGAVNGARLWYMGNTATAVVDTDATTWASYTPSTLNFAPPDYFGAPVISSTLPPLSFTPDGQYFSVEIDGIDLPDDPLYYSVAGTIVTLGAGIDITEIAMGVKIRYTKV